MVQARHTRRTKIVATLGPASLDPATVRALFDAGVDVFRLSASHGTHDDHAERYAIPHDLERSAVHPVAVLMDLQEPKLRVSAFEGGKVTLREGAAFRPDLGPAPSPPSRGTSPS